MPRKIVNRQLVNLNVNLVQNNSINQNVALNLRFVSDEVIVRQISHSSPTNAPVNPAACQIYFDKACDPIIGIFTLEINTNVAPQTRFYMPTGFQNGNVNLQIQTIPIDTTTIGKTGPGPLLVGVANQGQLAVILEFIKYE